MSRATEAALAKGECVVMSRHDEPMIRTSDATEAERIAQRVSGYVVYPKVVAA
ncbi:MULTISPECIES: hypothetical protein [unclassified Microbacterium]|uniref:hypothetical protein n=1 Tax=unclassified Microbacterium TaxID=2609290 RepID=UPI003C300876